MLFDEFCECTGDLSTDTEIEIKSTQNGTFWSKGKRKEKDRAIADQSRHISRLIGRSFKEYKRKARELADRSRKTS